MSITERTKRLLWSRSGGYCQNPECNTDFFTFFADGVISSFEELAHVIGQSKRGPRGESSMELTERDEYENIILLCPSCHKLIDKSPLQFPVEVLLQWKSKHEELIANLFSVPEYTDRSLLARDVHKLLRLNKRIFLEYGPHSQHSSDPLTDAALMWLRHVMKDIIPNNRKIASLLSINEALLKGDEIETVNAFRLHSEAFEYNHVSGDKNASAPLFPSEMNEILKD